MFERFSDDARRTVVRALVEARLLGHGYVGTEHTLIALAACNGPAAGALASEGVTLERARVAVSEIANGARTSSPWDDGPYTARAKHTFELGLREAYSHGHRFIASGHLLLGLLRLREGNGVRALQSLGVDLDVLWQKVEDSLGMEDPPEAPPSHRSTIGAGRLGIQKTAESVEPMELAESAPPPAETEDGGAARRGRVCSFCDREMGDDDRFVAGASAVICAACALACARLLAGAAVASDEAFAISSPPRPQGGDVSR